MPKVATWMRVKDEKWFHPFFLAHPDMNIANARDADVAIDDADGLLLTGGPDISQEFLRQPVPDPSVLDDDSDAARDKWEFAAVSQALDLGLPVLAICKGLQVLNVALNGTLLLDIRGHNLPEQKNHDIQPLRVDRHASNQFEKVNSSHHQAVDRLADGCEIEAWCVSDDIIEQFRLRDHPYALAVQYHPERGKIYDSLFADFFAYVKNHATRAKPLTR
jgi:putative glutamine amidotransferase